MINVYSKISIRKSKIGKIIINFILTKTPMNLI